MSLELSRNDIINSFFMLEECDNLKQFDNTNEVFNLFNSDILIIPFYKMGTGLVSSENLDRNEMYTNNNLKINYYNGNDLIYSQLLRSYNEIIQFGTIIIGTIAGLITIRDYLNRLFNENKHSSSDRPIFAIQIYIGNGNNNYNYYPFQGDVSNFNENSKIYMNDLKGKKGKV